MATLGAVNANGGEKRLRICTTGRLSILTADGRDVTPRGRKPRAILAYLASKAGRHASRERLMELLWGDRGEAQARASLRQALLEIRQATGDLVQADREHVWLVTSVAVESEADAGEAFADLNHVTPEFDEWLHGERERRSGEALQGLREQTERLLARGRGAAAAPLIERMRSIDPYNEDWLRLAMQADFQAGQPGAIEKRFKEMEQLLKGDLGVAPAAETRALRDRLLDELTRVPESEPAQETPGTILSRPVEGTRPLWRRKWVAAASVAAIAVSGGLLYNATTASTEPPRLAVLPFTAGAGVDPALAEGLSDELHTQLARNGGIRVIGRTSAAQFKGKPTDLRDVGRKLDARYIIEGTVREGDGRVSILVSLVRAKDGSALWSRNFVGAANRLEPVEAAIGGEIGRSLGTGTLAVAKPPSNGDAYALYLRAKGLLRNRDPESSDKAIELLRQANRIDPKSARIWAQLAGASALSYRPDVELSDGTRISRREAIERSLRLDPNLAEAHASAWLVTGKGMSTESRAHLRRALELDPNDPQALYWWALTHLQQGDLRRGGELAVRAARLDPLSKRPVGMAIEERLAAGDRSGALHYLRTIQAGNPRAAREIEASLAFADADYSRVVQLTIADREMPWDSGKWMGAATLFGLGFQREALLIAPVPPFYRAIWTGHVPPLSSILDQLGVRGEDDPDFLRIVIEQLTREKRWSDIAALYDSDITLMRDIRGNDSGARTLRVDIGPILAIGLNRAGRRSEAARAALAAGAAAKVFLANGGGRPVDFVKIGGAEAVLGYRDEALLHLERAFAMGWRMDESTPNPRLGDMLVFATLRGDPRFERLRRIQEAHLAKERREVLALGIL